MLKRRLEGGGCHRLPAGDRQVPHCAFRVRRTAALNKVLCDVGRVELDVGLVDTFQCLGDAEVVTLAARTGQTGEHRLTDELVREPEAPPKRWVADDEPGPFRPAHGFE